MKRHWKAALVLLSLVSGVSVAATYELLVGTGPTRVTRSASTNGVALQNKGGDAICCAQGTDAGYPNCFEVASGATLSLDIPSNQPVTCIAPNAQTVDAGTRVMEVF